MTVNTGENTEAAALAQTLTNGQQDQSQTVPVHVLQAIRQEFDQKFKAEREQNEALRQHFQMMQWQQQAKEQPKPYNPFEGKAPDDSIQVQDAMKLVQGIESKFNAKLNELSLASQNASYKDVINKYLPQAAKLDPEILSEIQSSSNPLKTAYMYASRAQLEEQMSGYRSQLDQKVSAPPKNQAVDKEAEKIIQNAKQSGNLSSVSNNAGMKNSEDGGLPDFSSMSDDDFRSFKSTVRFKPVRR